MVASFRGAAVSRKAEAYLSFCTEAGAYKQNQLPLLMAATRGAFSRWSGTLNYI